MCCGSYDHPWRACPHPPKCNACGVIGHLGTYCRTPVPQMPVHCGATDHPTAACPVQQPCFYCGEQAHPTQVPRAPMHCALHMGCRALGDGGIHAYPVAEGFTAH
ncbi:hypothetical protein FB451DRAFT_1403886 [Mycena latifolia]|nr:hypothetical protein FB451DRAFT_1403886 [Mycena latifolia]